MNRPDYDDDGTRGKRSGPVTIVEHVSYSISAPWSVAIEPFDMFIRRKVSHEQDSIRWSVKSEKGDE